MAGEDYFVLREINPETGNINALSSQQVRENIDKVLSNRQFIVDIIRGPVAGASDIICPDTNLADVTVNWVSNNYDGSSPYTETTDYLVALDGSDVVIDWSPGGIEPNVGSRYWVALTYTPTYSASGTALPNETTVHLNVTEGFNPETKVRRELSDVAGTPDKASIALTYLEFCPNNVGVGNDDRCMHVAVENDLIGGLTTELIPICLSNRIYGDTGTGTASNYCKYIFSSVNGQLSSGLQYRDDMVSNFGGSGLKLMIDASYLYLSTPNNHTTHYDVTVASTGRLGYFIFLPGMFAYANIHFTGVTAGKIRVSNGKSFFSIGTATTNQIITNKDFICQNCIYVEYWNDTGSPETITAVSFTISFFPNVQLPVIINGDNTLKFHITNTNAGASPSADLSFDCALKAEVTSLRVGISDFIIKQYEINMANTPFAVVNPPTPETYFGGREVLAGLPWAEVNATRINAGLSIELGGEPVIALPIGTILMYDGAGIVYTDARTEDIGSHSGDAIVLTGWKVCNGHAGTPDLRERFIEGCSNTEPEGTEGGSNSIVIAHTHTATTGAPSVNTSGTPSTNTSDGPSTNTSGNTGGSTDTVGNHTHPAVPGANNYMYDNGSQGTGLGTYGNVTYFPETGYGGSHSHNVNSHSHDLASHTHTMASHTHSLASHTHSLTTASSGSGSDSRPAYYALLFIRRCS